MGHRTQQIIFTLLIIGASIVPKAASSQDRGLTVLNQATTPKQVLGVFLLIGWALSPASRCGMGPAAFRTAVECQRAKGYTFEVSYPSQCVMTVTERRPPVNVKKKWDGTVTGSYIVAREITFDLHALSEDGIQIEPFTLLRLSSAERRGCEASWQGSCGESTRLDESTGGGTRAHQAERRMHSGYASSS
jgi:hypothetical protein